jgi:hypothetical protein
MIRIPAVLVVFIVAMITIAVVGVAALNAVGGQACQPPPGVTSR